MSQHPGGMVISTQPLIDLCPVQPASMEGRQMVQWDKDSCGGFAGSTCSGSVLSAVERCIDEIARVRGRRDRPLPHPLRRPRGLRPDPGGGAGVFQIESRAQMQMLKRTRPETLDDLTVQVALVRPGPIIGGAVHPYIERRKALREDPEYKVPYEHPSLEPVLRDTLGDRLPGPGARGVDGVRGLLGRRGRGAAAGDEPAPEAAIRAYEEKFVAGRRSAGPRERWPSGSGRRSWASPGSASRRRIRPPSGCSPTSRPGCGCTTTRSSCARS